MRRIDAVIKQAEVKFALGKHAEHIEALDQIADLVHQADDPRRRATWHYWRGFLGILTGGEPDTAIDHCNMAAKLAAERAMQTNTSGGSSDTDVNALAVIPTGCPSVPVVVTIVTPVRKWPSA